ncbi:TSUP family transporter, partial [Burkholderia pseudomallei]
TGHPATALGTDLIYAAHTKATGTFVHWLKGTLEWRISGRLAAGSVPAAAIPLGFLHAHGMHSQETSLMIQFVLGAA